MSKLIVMGNGMVGQRFLEAWAEKPSHSDWETYCFSEEPIPAYDRIHLSSYFETKDKDNLALTTQGWFKEKGFHLYLGDAVVKINRDKKTVETASGQTFAYDVLVLASGSRPFVPPLSGVDREGVFLYRTLEDLDKILQYSPKVKNAAVIGGGLLGLEAAKALKDLNLNAFVLEFAPRLMPRQIDQAGSSVLQKKLEALGVTIMTGKQAKSILGDQKVTGIEFSEGEPLEVQMVIISAGISPRSEVARDAGLLVHDRGGVLVDEQLLTSDPSIYAIGECAVAKGMVWGLAAPGYRMAESVAARIAGEMSPGFHGADLSTKLKLMGVDVASIGDSVPQANQYDEVTLHDTTTGIYKKLHLDKLTGKIKGAILVGDATDYSQILQLYLNNMDIPGKPENLLVKGGGTIEIGVDSLPEGAVICSCNNVTKASILKIVLNGFHKLEELKDHSKAGITCGSCQTMVKQILHRELEKSGVEVDKSLCEHFKFTRMELFDIVRVQEIKSFDILIAQHGQGRGCEICKPTAASIFASLWNENAQVQPTLQDSNDIYMANIQKNGTYSVVPRVPGGELTPDQLIAMGQVAKDFSLYTKITGAQRVDLFGARVDQLPAIWSRLRDAGLESGQAYAKALRAVKSCVGSSWCRFGVQDSTALAIELEHRYRGLRSPHKLKFGVSGCARECAEARGKDIGVIATQKGWNLYVCGNGGMNPKHAVLFANDLDKETLIRYIDRILIYYIRTADRLTRTSVWLEQLSGGMDKLKKVVIEDSLGIAADMESHMALAVENYECEWAATLNDPEKLKRFKPFLNSDQPDASIQFTQVRGQIQPLTSGGVK